MAQVLICRGMVAAVALSLSLCGASSAAAQDVRVAAASDLQAALPEVARRFAAATGFRAQPIFGSSGLLATQIRNGAPFDVYMSADIAYPRQLADAGFAERGAVAAYAVGRIVLWTRNDSTVDLEAGIRGLTAKSIRRVAIANPEHAPYGRAAAAALKHEGVYEALRGRLVLGENIAQATQFAQSGNVDAALTAWALAVGSVSQHAGRYALIPAEWHAPIMQGAVWLKNATNPRAARQFVEFLLRPEIVEYLQTMGFEPVTP